MQKPTPQKQCAGPCGKRLPITSFVIIEKFGGRAIGRFCKACASQMPPPRRQCRKCGSLKNRDQYGNHPGGEYRPDTFCLPCREKYPYRHHAL